MPRRRECLQCGAHTMDVCCSNCGGIELRLVPMNAADDRERLLADGRGAGRDAARSFDAGEARRTGPSPT
jgi:hypothetical protein